MQNNPNPDLVDENEKTERTILVMLIRLNQSIAKLTANQKFPKSNKPHTTDMYRSVHQDFFELIRLVRATLSDSLIKQITVWGTSPANNLFTKTARELSDKVYDELSEGGMIDIRVRKTATFPMNFYISRIPELQTNNNNKVIYQDEKVSITDKEV